MNLALWITAGLLSVVFLISSTSKLFVPMEKLAAARGGEWTADFSVGFIKTIGAIELLPAAGLVLPAAVGIAPVLVPLAALGASLLMAGAIIMRLRRRERLTFLGDLVYLSLAVFIAWGRFGPEPFAG